MVIQTLSNLCDEGYVAKDDRSLISPFFSGANVAFRRKAFDEVGLYDERCATGEDQDISMRIAASRWEMYFEPRAVVGHKCRPSVRSFLRQWYNYGLHHPYIFKKHGPKALSIYVRRPKPTDGVLYRRLVHLKRFPFHVIMFVGPFLLMNLLALVAVVSAIFTWWAAAAVSGACALLAALVYFLPDVVLRKPVQTLQFILLRYVSNVVLLGGSLIGGIKARMVYVGGTLDYTKPRTGPGERGRRAC